MVKLFRNFVAEESGATALEYALLASLIAVVIVTVVSNIGTSLNSEMSEVSGALK